jgi:hypothetical protein
VLSNVALPAAAWYFPTVVRFSLAERKNEQQKEDKVPLCRRLKTPTA